MVKKILVALLLSLSLLFVGCGESESESRLETQQMLDDANYVGVITKLEGRAVSNEDYLALAAAYMGKAGLSFSDLVEVVAASNENANNDAFGAFVQSISTNSSPTALADLGSSTLNYEKVMNGACEDATLTLTDSQKDICLFIGLAQSMKAATTLSYLGDVASFGDITGDPDAQLSASVCAMQYAYDGTTGDACTIELLDTPVTFDSNNTYDALKVSVNANTYDFFMTTNTTPKQTIITDGYCTTSFVSCTQGDEGCYVCPVNQTKDAQELTAANILVDVLNGGFDAVVAATGGLDSDVAADIEKYRTEITGSANGDVTVESIIDYINEQNK